MIEKNERERERQRLDLCKAHFVTKTKTKKRDKTREYTQSFLSCRVQFPTLPFPSLLIFISSYIQRSTLTTIISHVVIKDNITSSFTKIYES